MLKMTRSTSWGMQLDPAVVHQGDSDLDALRKVSVDALTNPTYEALWKRLEWLMLLGGVTEELIDLRRALWTIPETREALLEYYEHLGVFMLPLLHSISMGMAVTPQLCLTKLGDELLGRIKNLTESLSSGARFPKSSSRRGQGGYSLHVCPRRI